MTIYFGGQKYNKILHPPSAICELADWRIGELADWRIGGLRIANWRITDLKFYHRMSSWPLFISPFSLPHFPHYQITTFFSPAERGKKIPLPEMTGGKPSRHAI